MPDLVRQVIVQPTSGCNLNCGYCYVANRRDLTRMDDATLTAAIRAVLRSELVQDEVEFVWHAGEPLLVGPDFYRRALDVIAAGNPRGIRVRHAVQTNATLVTPQWCGLFAEHQFAVGVSIDGPAFLHDRQRANWAGRGSLKDTMRGYALLREHGLRPGVICVLTRESLRHPDEIFDFFLHHEVDFVCFNVEEVENLNTASSLSAVDLADRHEVQRSYAAFLSRFFDRWRPHAPTMLVREFRDMSRAFERVRADHAYAASPLEAADLGILTIARNGDITAYSPELAGAHSSRYADFAVGNVLRDSLDSILEHPTYLAMRDDIHEGVRRCRESCGYFAVCGGGFTSNKFFENGTFASTETGTCRLHRQTLASVLAGKLARADPETLFVIPDPPHPADPSISR